MKDLQCWVNGCTRSPEETIPVDEAGLAVVYAVCAEHLTAMRELAMLAAPDEMTRGLIGKFG